MNGFGGLGFSTAANAWRLCVFLVALIGLGAFVPEQDRPGPSHAVAASVPPPPRSLQLRANTCFSNAVSLQSAIDSSPSGGTVSLAGCTVELGSTVSVRRTVHLAGPGVLKASGSLYSPLLIISADAVTISDVTLSGIGARVPQLLQIAASNVTVARCTFTGSGQYTYAESQRDVRLRPLAAVWIQGARGSNSVSDVSIVDSVFRRNGAVDVGGYDIVANYFPADSRRLSVISSRFAESTTAITVCLFDTSDSIIERNVIDQANRSDEYTAHATHTQDDGYGILIYNTPAALLPCARNLVRANHVRNTASSGIYLQGTIYSAIRDNVVENACQVPDGSFVPDTTVNVGSIAANGGNPASPEGLAIAISGNAIMKSGKNGVSIANTRDALIHRNQITGASKNGIDVRNREPGAIISGNVITGPSLRGISFTAGAGTPVGLKAIGNTVNGTAIGILVRTGSRDIQIIGNHISNSRQYGVQLLRARHAVVRGNHIDQSAGPSLYLTGNQCVVSGNRLSSKAPGTAIFILPPDAFDTLVRGNLFATGDDRALVDLGDRTVLEGNAFHAEPGPGSLPRSTGGAPAPTR